MEKYSKFSDESTGIQPFRSVRPNSAHFNTAQTIAIWILTVICTPLSYISIMLYFGLFRWMLPRFLSKFLLNDLVFISTRLLYSRFFYEGENRASVRKKSLIRAQPGDILLSNFLSPLDPLIYESHRSVHFAFPTTDARFKRLSTLQAMKRALDLRPISSGTGLPELSLNAKKEGAILVVFVEGTTSNGRGLLSLKGIDTRSIAAVESRVFPAAIKYTPQAACAPVPSSLWNYLWTTSRSSWWYMASVKVSGEPLAKATISPDQISKNIAALGRLRIFGDRMNITTKREFVEESRNRAQYRTQSQEEVKPLAPTRVLLSTADGKHDGLRRTGALKYEAFSKTRLHVFTRRMYLLPN